MSCVVTGGPHDKGSCMLWEPVHDVRGLDGVGLRSRRAALRLRRPARALGVTSCDCDCDCDCRCDCDCPHATAARGLPPQAAALRETTR